MFAIAGLGPKNQPALNLSETNSTTVFWPFQHSFQASCPSYTEGALHLQLRSTSRRRLGPSTCPLLRQGVDSTRSSEGTDLPRTCLGPPFTCRRIPGLCVFCPMADSSTFFHTKDHSFVY